MALLNILRHNQIIKQGGILLSSSFLLQFFLFPGQSVQAQSLELSCFVIQNTRHNFDNAASSSYSPDPNSNIFQIPQSSNLARVFTATTKELNVVISPQGIVAVADNSRVVSMGVLTDAIAALLRVSGLSSSEAADSGILAIRTLIGQQKSVPIKLIATLVKQGVILEFPAQTANVQAISDAAILQILSATTAPQLQSLGLNYQASLAAATVAQNVITEMYNTYPNITFEYMVSEVQSRVLAAIATANVPIAEQERLASSFTALTEEIDRLRNATDPTVTAGTAFYFDFALVNTEDSSARITLPTFDTIAANAVTGPATLESVTYTSDFPTGQSISGAIGNQRIVVDLPAQGVLKLRLKIVLGPYNIEQVTTIRAGFSTDCGGKDIEQSFTLLPPLNYPLVDPLGRVTGCAGESLPDYRGFQIGLYDPASPGSTEIGQLTTMTTTEFPDTVGNNIPPGLPPNIENSNPFFLTNSDLGRYNFLFDGKTGQLDKGREFILLVTPPPGSVYDGRRVRITIGDRVGNTIAYVATSLDGRPISGTDGRTSINGTLNISDATTVGLSLAVLQLSTSVCQPTEIKIEKTGDRAVVAPGDTILYRLNIRNLANSAVENLVIDDVLPRGFKFVENSARAGTQESPRTVITTVDGRNITFAIAGTLDSQASFNLVYAAQVTPDAIRGSGKNYAMVEGERVRDKREVKDGPAIYAVRMDEGIIKSCGTIIGRVFVDKNFDGEQQSGEPGIPNAVIYLEDGNRIITDEHGLYSVVNALPGYHTGALDLTSLPGYTLAPNLKFIESNSKSRVVNLAPGSMVRMNFAVTPTFNEEAK